MITSKIYVQKDKNKLSGKKLPENLPTLAHTAPFTTKSDKCFSVWSAVKSKCSAILCVRIRVKHFAITRILCSIIRFCKSFQRVSPSSVFKKNEKKSSKKRPQKSSQAKVQKIFFNLPY